MRLEDICKVFTDGDWIESKNQSDEGIRLVQTGNIGEGKFLEKGDRAKYISEVTFDSLKCTEIFPGDILVSRLPEPVGRACIIPEKDERMITAVDCTICRPDENMILKEYLCYFMQSEAYYTRLMNNVTGTTRKRISRKNLGNVELDIPDKETQAAVVKNLDALSRIIDGRKEELDKLDELVKARFVEMFGNPIHPAQFKKLGDIALLERGRFSPRPRNDPRYFGGEYPFIQTGDIASSNHRLFEYKQTLNEEGIKVSKKFNVGTIVMAIVGATIGATSILQREVYAPDSVIGISPYKYDNVFLEVLLQFWKPQLLAIAPESARANINLGILNDIPIIDVSVEKQESFSSFAKQVDKSKVAVQKALDETQLLFNSLMQEYFG